MKKTLLFLVLLIGTIPFYAQEGAEEQAMLDSLNKKLNFETGTITLREGDANINVPEGFKFLNDKSSQWVLETLWGNMPDNSVLGMLFPADKSPLDSACWAFVITFDNMGYVKDEDADKIDYNDLLAELKKDSEAANAERTKLGYPSAHLVGWAATPYYDKSMKALHWAKEIRFDSESTNTLNYDVRLLNKKGVLSFNAVGTVDQVQEIKGKISPLISSVTFKEGSRYADFNPSVDKVAALTIGGLVAGKVLAKVGFFAVILKFGKVIFVAIAAAGGAAWRFLTGRKGDA